MKLCAYCAGYILSIALVRANMVHIQQCDMHCIFRQHLAWRKPCIQYIFSLRSTLVGSCVLLKGCFWLQNRGRLALQDQRMECPICLDPLGSNVQALPCTHKFHKKCLARLHEYNKSCPLCRRHFRREDIEDRDKGAWSPDDKTRFITALLACVFGLLLCLAVAPVLQATQTGLINIIKAASPTAGHLYRITTGLASILCALYLGMAVIVLVGVQCVPVNMPFWCVAILLFFCIVLWFAVIMVVLCLYGFYNVFMFGQIGTGPTQLSRPWP